MKAYTPEAEMGGFSWYAQGRVHCRDYGVQAHAHPG